MKLPLNKTTTLLLLFGSQFAFSQIALGKASINGTQTVLDFNDAATNDKGIILPAVTPLPTLASTTNGTFLFDRTDSRVKVLENNIWKPLSDAGNSTALNANNNTSAETTGKVIFGESTSSAEGILVLESPDKAMILPKISNPHTTVHNPYPGMMCYDTVSKSLAVFDGTRWNYWK